MGIETFLQQEDEVFRKSWPCYEDKIEAFDMMAMILIETAKSIEAMKERRSDVATFFVQLFHQMHVYLRLAFVLTLRGHYTESWSVLRPAVEIASHIFKMSVDPKTRANIWLKQDEGSFKKQYAKIFEKDLFPTNEALLYPLRKVYDNCCKYASHSTFYMLVNKSDFKRQDGKITHHFYDFHADDHKSEVHLIYILDVVQKILRIMKASFTRVIDDKEFIPIAAVYEIADQQLTNARRTKLSLKSR